MDETPNVNNLNGVPNFGHGFPANTEESTPADTPAEPMAEAESQDEEAESEPSEPVEPEQA